MGATSGRWAFALGTLCLGMTPQPARAAQGAVAAGAPAYDVPGGCPAREVWLESLRARLPSLLRTHPLLEQLSVRVTRKGGASGASYEGTLGGADESLGGGRRELRGASCEEVLAALSFVAALALQRVTATESYSTGSGSPPVLAPERVDSPSVMPDPGGTQLGVQVFVLLQDGLSGLSGLAAGGGMQLSWPAVVWQPLLLLGVYLGGDDERLAAGATARLRQGALQAVACPWRWGLLGPLGLRPCAELELGVISGEATGVREAERQLAPWVSMGLQLRAEVAVGRAWQLGAWLGGAAPLSRSRFYFRPDVTVYETAGLGLRAGGFVGLSF